MQQGNSPCLLLLSLIGHTPLHSSLGTPITHLSQRRVFWVPWWKGHPATYLVGGSTNWRSINFCIQIPEWYTQKDWVGAWSWQWHLCQSHYPVAWLCSRMSPLSCRWTSHSSQWKDVSPKPCLSAVAQPPLPPHALPWCLPQSRESSQHDHGGQWTPIVGNSEYLWSSLGEFCPKKTSVCGLRSTTLSLSWARSFHQTNGHLFPGVPTSEHPRWCEARHSNPWGDLCFLSLPVETLGPGTSALPKDVIQLQEEAGRAFGCLLANRSALDTQWRKQVLDFLIVLHQNESEATKAIKEAQALCSCTIREAEACWVILIREAEAWHPTCIKEAEANCASNIAEVENCCSVAIREAESHSAKQACSIQQSHAEGMQHLEAEAIEEEGKDCLSFLTACGVALWASPQSPWGHGDPLPSAPGKHTFVYSAKYSPEYLPLDLNLSHRVLILQPLWHLGPCSDPNGDTPHLARLNPHLNQKLLPEQPLRSHPAWSKRMKCPFTKCYQGVGRKPLPGIRI